MTGASSTPPPGSRPAPAERLDLAPHPEGGWYRRTWTSPATLAGDRPAATAVLYLLTAGEWSRWHTVDADELWLWHGPDPLTLQLADAPGDVADEHTLGPDAVQLLVPAGRWQRTAAATGEVLVTCVVSPGFTWSGFQLG
ncbi:MAG: cupin [Modestobacter sp.]|nr:cupin [Modestobacter sp.]HEV7726466.1 cupin domain-containing protein [Modestobacter sp.]